MEFSYWAIKKARPRQYRGDGRGIVCARCGEHIRSSEEHTIPRIPIEQGGKKASNCVIVCPKCYLEIKQDGTKIIPFSELPFFEV